jgi:hypothetical protein
MSKQAATVDWQSKLVEHEQAIKGLSDDVGGLKLEVQGIHKAMNLHHHDLSSKFDKLMAKDDARPVFDPHKWIGTILSLSILFVMIVSGIIYVAQSQFAAVIAKQDILNSNVNQSLSDQQQKLDDIGGRVGWYPTTKKAER